MEKTNRMKLDHQLRLLTEIVKDVISGIEFNNITELQEVLVPAAENLITLFCDYLAEDIALVESRGRLTADAMRDLLTDVKNEISITTNSDKKKMLESVYFIVNASKEVLEKHVIPECLIK